jgi:hypothetical protein
MVPHHKAGAYERYERECDIREYDFESRIVKSQGSYVT